MRIPLIMCVLAAVCLSATTALTKKTPDENRPAPHDPQSIPHHLEVNGTPGFAAAAAETTVLAWWQFDDPYTGTCDAQGWTSADLTAQLALYFHLDGNAAEAGCSGIVPVSGEKSMWCGQAPSAADPWCGWETLPGYGKNWDQSLVSDTLVCDTLTWTWTAVWDTEAGYDFGYAEYWDASTSRWSRLPVVGGYGKYEGSGGPFVDSHEIVPPEGWTILRYRFTSDGAWDDEDGLWPSIEGAIKIDDVTVACWDGPTFSHDFEGEACGDHETTDGFWTAGAPEPFGNYARLVGGSTVVQEDPCRTVLSCMWAFFDDPEVTNYACGGWPIQGATPYRRWVDGTCQPQTNEIRSPWVPISGTGSEFRLSFLTYRDLTLDDLVFNTWYVRTKDSTGCPGPWRNFNFIYYGGQKDWFRREFSFGSLVPADAVEIQVAVGVADYYCLWGWDPACHSHAPLIDQVRLVRVDSHGPEWVVRHIDLWQDNFPDEGGVDPATSFTRCDMAQDILPNSMGGILPGDSLVVTVTDPNGLNSDNTGGRPGKAVYAFVRVTDPYGNPQAGKSGTAIQSPDDRAFTADPHIGSLRWPHAGNVTVAGDVWGFYRMDYVYNASGAIVEDRFCCDLMDLGSGATGPHYNHVNENTPANTGIFAPGDVISYFLGARSAVGEWTFWHRTYHGQGLDNQTSDINAAAASPCEWSVLPGFGLEPDDDGDILYVDDADDRVITDDVKLRGDPVQAYFDWAFWYTTFAGVDRFDVLGPSSIVGNSLASRVKNVQNQLIGPVTEVYQQIIWNSSNLSRGALVGDGGWVNGGSGQEKSDDYAVFNEFLGTHPNNPGIYLAGDDAAEEWASYSGAGAVFARNTYMNFGLAGDSHIVTGEVVSPLLVTDVPGSYGVFDNMFYPDVHYCYAYGGCPAINDFDVMTAVANSRVELAYPTGYPAYGAVMAQETPNSAGSTARFVLAGFGYDFIRDQSITDYSSPEVYNSRCRFIADVLTWFGNSLPMTTAVDPVAYENALEAAYPNPFNPSTTIRYAIAERSHVSLKVYNVAGQHIQTLVDEIQSPRPEGYRAAWDGTSADGGNVASGVYFYKLTTKGFSKTKKMVLLK
jgi:hypothetical protein